METEGKHSELDSWIDCLRELSSWRTQVYDENQDSSSRAARMSDTYCRNANHYHLTMQWNPVAHNSERQEDK